MSGRSPARRHRPLGKRMADGNRKLRSELLETRWMPSGQGLAGLEAALAWRCEPFEARSVPSGQGLAGMGAALAWPYLPGASLGPTVVTAATATLAAGDRTASLSVAATDPAASAGLTYTWWLILGPPADTATFITNGSGSSKQDTVTFGAAGTYDLGVRITDPSGFSTVSSVIVPVSQVLSGITVTPASTAIPVGGSQQYAVVGRDQFGNAMAVSAPVVWGSTAGTITAKGLFTAPGQSMAKVTITAQCGKFSGTATAVVSRLPTLTAPVAVTLNGTLTGAALQVQATDDYGGADLNYWWSTLSAPAGGSASFSANQSHAAADTTVTFTKAGSYGLEVTTVEANGLDLVTTVTVAVAARATSAVVTPASASLAAGATQQFVASARDQFGSALATQPTFTWSATAGAVNAATGLFTAPQSAETLAVTARTGALSGTAQVTVTASTAGGDFLGLHDQNLAALVKSLDAAGSINRQDMLAIFGDVERSYSTLSAAELSDLQAIVADAAALDMPGYVQALAAYVVDGNPANAQYQGRSLGNLAPGSSTAQLATLVSKWFLGTDHPADGGLSYQVVSGSLFGSGPSYTDVAQGAVGDCYFVSAMGIIAKQSPATIENMFINNGDGTYTVRFYAGTESYAMNRDGSWTEGFAGTPTVSYVTVDSLLPVGYNGCLVFDGAGWSAGNPNNKLWLPLLEKAYAQWDQTGLEWRATGVTGLNSYAGIASGWMSDVNCQVLGHASVDYGLAQADGWQSLVAALDANQAVTIATDQSSNQGDTLSYGLYGSHAYAVTGYNAATGQFSLYNPWGFDQPNALTWTQLAATCGFFSVTNPSGTPALSAATAPTLAGIAQLLEGQPSPTAFDACFASSDNDLILRRSANLGN